jgi:2-oxoglutarate ferredoxin oxidoreductase subunit alpha
MTEPPLVVVLAQRPGPATGLPTRTGQEELLYALHAGAGESPRVILAPGDPYEAVHLMAKAFNLAERYQVTVIILSDQALADSSYTLEGLDTDRVRVERGPMWEPAGRPPYSYKRHAFTEDGVSPRLFPGTREQLVITDSDEHTEDGHLTEDLAVRVKMVEKRNLRKWPHLASEIAPPQLYGPAKAEVTLMGWGTTRGAMCEAVDLLRERGLAANALIFKELWPLPAEAVRQALAAKRTLVGVEGNLTAQMAELVYQETGIACDHLVLRYDGRPMTADYILRELSGLI